MSQELDDWLLDIADEPEKQRLMLDAFKRMDDEIRDACVQFSLLPDLRNLADYSERQRNEFAQIGFNLYTALIAHLESELEAEIGGEVC